MRNSLGVQTQEVFILRHQKPSCLPSIIEKDFVVCAAPARFDSGGHVDASPPQPLSHGKRNMFVEEEAQPCAHRSVSASSFLSLDCTCEG